MTDADWLAAVAASPDDPLVRLVYADWLDDRDDPRGELLRLDVELFSKPSDERLYGRLRELVVNADVVWRAAVCRVPLDYELDPEGIDEFPWYVADYCACSGPVSIAPTHCDADPTRGHWPIRQPQTPVEVAVLCRAARVCERQVIRYGGQDPVVIGQLGNDPDRFDYLIDEDTATVYRATAAAVVARVWNRAVDPGDALEVPSVNAPIEPVQIPIANPPRSWSTPSDLTRVVRSLSEDHEFLPLPGSDPDRTMDEVIQSGFVVVVLVAVTTLIGIVYFMRQTGRI